MIREGVVITEDDGRPPQRELVLKPVDGKATNVLGNVDKRLFTGENNCRVIMEDQTGLWFLKMDKGALPEPLRDVRFTSFNKAKEHAEAYYKTRNVEIADVKR